MSTKGGECDQWTQSNGRQHAQELIDAVAAIVQWDKESAQLLETLLKVRLDQVREKAGISRRRQAHVRSVFGHKSVVKQGWPAGLMSWLSDNVFEIAEGKSDCVTRAATITVEESGVHLTDFCLATDKDADDAYFGGVKTFLDVAEHSGMSKCKSVLVNTLVGSTLNGTVRVAYTSGDKTKLSDAACGEEWKFPGRQTAIAPDGFLTFGAPVVFADLFMSFRHSYMSFPFAGLAGHLRVIQGSLLVLVWDSKLMASTNVSFGEMFNILDELTPHDASAFASKCCKFIKLDPGETLWIPFGYRVTTFGLEKDSPTLTLWVPWFSAEALVGVEKSFLKTVLAHNISELNAHAESLLFKKNFVSIRQWFGDMVGRFIDK